MSINVVCSACGKKYRLKDELEGRKFRCKGCEQVVVVAESATAGAARHAEPAGTSAKRRSASAEGQRTRRKRKRPVDPYAADDLFGSALDRFDGNYGEAIPDEDNPYRAPSYQGSSARRRRSTSSEQLTIAQKLFSISGRINRRDYWSISLLSGVAFNVVLAVLEGVINSPVPAMIAIVLMIPPYLWISLAVQIKRWHDRDKSGAWFFINFIPIIGPLWSFVECGCLAGTPGENTYGSEPE